MRKVIALVSSLLLVVTFATPAQSAGAKYSVYQKTLATFSSSATTLTTQQKSQVKVTVEANPTAEKFICTGIRYYDQPMSVNITVRKRAKAACEYAKQLNPALSTWFQNKPTKARSYAGKVLLTVKSPTAPISLDNLDATRAHREAWQSVRDAYNNGDVLEPEIKYYMSPRITPEMLAIEREVLDRTAKLWSGEFTPKNARIIYVHRGDPSEKAWLSETTKELGITISDDWYDNSCGALGSNSNGYLTIIQCLGFKVTAKRLHVIAHEYTHWYQFDAGDIPGNGPNWLVEGGATFYGSVIGFMGTDDEWKTRLSFIRDPLYGDDLQNGEPIGTLRDWVLSSTKEQFISLMTRIERGGGPGEAGQQYLFGNLASEALVASFGHSKMIEFYESFRASPDWRANFESVYGLSVEEFYGKLHPYVMDVIEQVASQE
ncbi:hypothetical protein IMCC13023_05700 [Candidatus Aquiluna sp. IMCC13023]|uniref:hypothetical protein n=1 Tax=Candidatus Aquiluna sp. IMCC13023 TaxID=1081644 RepID=UPI00025B2DCA|nr:hypothetical protein [Candidatus Aquiluna sp. IMCC13023]EIC92091.1 hypothetical protein IMCC13023_05700 [Candidatus Aquiluna sp. IMCC13023]